MIDNCADDWRIAMTWQRIVRIAIELITCAVHPIPGKYFFLWTTKLSNHGGVEGSQWVPIDITLSLPMFLRLYLICRVMLLHSKVSGGAVASRVFGRGVVTASALSVWSCVAAVCPCPSLL